MCCFIRRFFKSKGISYHQGQKQKYLISCSFPVLFFVLVLTRMAKWKKQSAGTWSQSSDLEPTAWNLFLVAYLALLSSSHLQRLLHFQRRDHFCKGEQVRQVKMIHRSMWRQAQQIYVLIHSLLLRKQRYLISVSYTHLTLPTILLV